MSYSPIPSLLSSPRTISTWSERFLHRNQSSGTNSPVSSGILSPAPSVRSLQTENPWKQRASELEEESSINKQMVKTLSDKLVDLQDEVTDQKNHISGLEKKMHGIENLERENGILKGKIRDMDEGMESMHDTIEHLRSDKQRLEKVVEQHDAGEFQHLRDQVYSLTSQIEKRDEDASASETRIHELENSCENLKSQLTRAKEKIETQKAENKALNDHGQELTCDTLEVADMYKSTNDELAEAVAQTKTILAETKDENHLLEAENQALKAELKVLKSQLENSKGSLKKKKTKYAPVNKIAGARRRPSKTKQKQVLPATIEAGKSNGDVHGKPEAEEEHMENLVKKAETADAEDTKMGENGELVESVERKE